MFAGRDTVDLTGYDPDFAPGWGMLEKALADTVLSGPLWDTRGRRQQTLTLGFGALAFVGGLLLTGVGAALASRTGRGWLVLVAISAAIAGAAIGVILNSFELRIRTEVATGYWLRIESFRRFIADSEACHVDAAAEKGLLRQYTAWAVALGESKAWLRAVDAATSHDPSRYSTLGRDIGFVAVSNHIVSAAKSTSAAPSSSGGGGGGAGGGGGGGGGGSW